jgi:plastocyanin
MGAIETAAKGEWHMHCHLLMHMDDGMMGSLLVLNGGESALFHLPKGDPSLACNMPDMGPTGTPLTATVRGTSGCQWTDDTSHTSETTVKVGGTVTWIDAGGCGPSHTVVSDNVATFDMLMPALNLAVPVPPNTVGVARTFATAGSFGYHCGIHGGDPSARSGMWGIVHVVS